MKCLYFTLCILVVFSLVFVFGGCEEQSPQQRTTEAKPDAAKLLESQKLSAEGKTPVEKMPESVSVKEPEKTVQAESKSSGPEIKFVSKMHDFGQVSPKSSSECKFKFTNIGGGVLEIKNIRSTCGCTVAKLAKKKYAPGESGEIDVSLKAGVASVPIKKNLYVLSNDKKNPSVTLTVQASVKKVIDYEPETISLSLKQENAGCPEIKIRSLDGKIFSVTQFKSSPDSIVADFDPNQKATEFVLKPRVNMKKLEQNLSGYVRIYLDHPDCSLLTISYSAPAEFSSRPAVILVFKAQPGKTVIKEDVWVTDNYNGDFDIESFSSEKGFVKVLSSEKVDKGSYKLKLQIDPPELGRKERSFQDNLIVAIKGGKQLKVACRGFYEGS